MTTPVRVLRVIARLNVGGPALQATVLSRGLDRERFEQRLLAGRVGAGEGDYVTLRASDLPVQQIDGLGRDPRPWSDGHAFAAISRAIRDHRPHIVHTHTSKAGVLGRLAAWRRRVPATVHTFHGHHLVGYFSPAVTRAVVEAERRLARRTTRLVAVGAQVRDDLLAAGIGRPEQFSVVAPGVELPTPPDRAAARAALDIPDDRPVVCFVARLTRVKRPDRFADAVLDVARRHPSLVVLVAGEGEELEDLRRRLAPLGRSARFLGWREDVEVVYAASDVAVLTSDNEGMPVSLIEAQHCGVPAVTTRVGSAGEVVVDGVTGLVTAVSADAVADAVDRLLRDPQLRARMSTAARERAAAQFGAGRLVADITALYESIASELGV